MNLIISLIITLGILMTGCAGTVRLDKVETVTVCVGGKCRPIDHETDVAALRGALYRLFKSNEGRSYTACAASPDSRKCSSKGLSHYVQGGPIPGVGTLKGMEIEEVGYDPSAEMIVAVVDPAIYFIGTPLITTKHKTTLTVAEPDKITLVDQESYTNWMAVGNQIFSFNFAADYIDIDRGVLGGWYGWGVTGIGTGGGSGYALLTFPKKGDISWFAEIPNDAPLLATPVSEGQKDPIAQKAEVTVASGAGVTSGEAADYANELAMEQKRVAMAENTLASEAKRAELKRQQLAQRDEALKLSHEQEDLVKERQLLDQERQRLEEVRQSAEKRRKELEALREELEKQRLEAIRLQEERKTAELERQRLEALKAEELERLRTLNLKVNFGNYHALVIGNNEYQSFPKLKTAVNDSMAIAKLLQEGYKFQATLLTNATRGQILRALNDLRKTLDKNDNLLIYYAGHGWLDKAADEGYWLPVDAAPDDPVNWIANSSITAAITAITAKHVMVIADSCYSGKLMRGVKVREKGTGVLEKLAGKRTRVVMSSGGLEPVTDAGAGEHSIFAAALITALKENKGVIDGTQLFDQVRQPVMANADQTPEYADIHKAGHDGGDFIFVRR